MRMTFNIDDDLLRQLKRRAKESGTPVRQIMNAALREGLTELCPPRPKKPYVCPTFDMGKPTANLDKVLALAVSLEDAQSPGPARIDDA